MTSPQTGLALLLRVIAGILAVLAFALVGLRLYSLSHQQVSDAESLMHSLRILFPASLGAILAYLAIKGRIPFSNDSPKQDQDD